MESNTTKSAADPPPSPSGSKAPASDKFDTATEGHSSDEGNCDYEVTNSNDEGTDKKTSPKVTRTIHRMSAPVSKRAKEHALQAAQKPNPRKRLAALVAKYPFQRAANASEESSTSKTPTSNKRKRGIDEAGVEDPDSGAGTGGDGTTEHSTDEENEVIEPLKKQKV